MAYGLFLTLDQRKWRADDYSSDNGLTGTVYTDEKKTIAKNLTGYTVNVLIYKRWSNAILFWKAATIVTAASGTWKYLVKKGEMVSPGLYFVEIELNKSGVVESTEPEELLVQYSPYVGEQ